MSNIAPIRFETGRRMLLGGLRRRHAFADAAQTIPAQWRDFHALGTIPGQRSGVTYGVVCGSDQAGFEYMTGIEVAGFEGLPPAMGRMRVPEQRYAVFEHAAPVAGIRRTWERIWQEWLPTSGHAPADTPDFEVYGERFDPVTGQGGVEIWFPIAAPDAPNAWRPEARAASSTRGS